MRQQSVQYRCPVRLHIPGIQFVQVRASLWYPQEEPSCASPMSPTDDLAVIDPIGAFSEMIPVSGIKD